MTYILNAGEDPVHPITPLGYGTRPGFAIWLSNIFQNFDTFGAFPSLSDGGTAICYCLGFSDLVNRLTQASGVSDAATNVFISPLYDGGASSLRELPTSTHRLGFYESVADDGDTYMTCYDADYRSEHTSTVLYLGGHCRAQADLVALRTTTGDQAVTGVGFEPDVVLFFGGYPPGTTDGEGAGTNFTIGAMDKDGNQWAFHCQSNMLSGPGQLNNQTQRYSQGVTDACLMSFTTESTGFGTFTPQRAHYVSMDTDGFTINVSEAGLSTFGAASSFGYMALRADVGHAAFKVGSGTQGDTAISAGFQPDAVFFASCGLEDEDVSSDCYLSYGLVGLSGTTEEQRCYWGGTTSGDVGSGIPPCSAYMASSKALFFADNTETILAEGDATLTSDGADITWTGDSANRIFGWVALQADDFIRFPPDLLGGEGSGCNTTATINATGTPNTEAEHPIQFIFEWGTSLFYGNTIDLGLVSGFDPILVSAELTGLTPGTTYHYRLVSIDGLCINEGPDNDFLQEECAPNFSIRAVFGLGT